MWFKKIIKKKERYDRCAYCGEYTKIKKYYGGYGEYGYIIGSPCCSKCDEANQIRWDKEIIEEERRKITEPPNKKQSKWRKKRDAILSKPK